MRPFLSPPCAALVLALSLSPTACRNQVPAADVVARVNGEAITKSTFEESVARDLKRYGEQRQTLAEGVVARIQEAVLQGIVEDCIVRQRADEEGLQVTDAELDETLAQHQTRFRSKEAYQDYLARANTTEDQLRRALRQSMLRDRLVDKLGGPIEVAAADVKRYYDDNPEHFIKLEQMRVRRLYLAFPQDKAGSKVRAIKKQAHALYQRAKKHPDTFAQLCREHSDAPEAGRDGDLGLIVGGRLPEVDKLVAAGLQPGQVSEPVTLPQGVALFRLDSHSPRSRQPLEEVAPQIRTTLLLHLRNERRQEVMQALKAAAKVDVHISFDRRTGSGKTPPLTPTSAPARQEIGRNTRGTGLVVERRA